MHIIKSISRKSRIGENKLVSLIYEIINKLHFLTNEKHETKTTLTCNCIHKEHGNNLIQKQESVID